MRWKFLVDSLNVFKTEEHQSFVQWNLWRVFWNLSSKIIKFCGFSRVLRKLVLVKVLWCLSASWKNFPILDFILTFLFFLLSFVLFRDLRSFLYFYFVCPNAGQLSLYLQLSISMSSALSSLHSLSLSLFIFPFLLFLLFTPSLFPFFLYTSLSCSLFSLIFRYMYIYEPSTLVFLYHIFSLSPSIHNYFCALFPLKLAQHISRLLQCMISYSERYYWRVNDILAFGVASSTPNIVQRFSHEYSYDFVFLLAALPVSCNSSPMSTLSIWCP